LQLFFASSEQRLGTRLKSVKVILTDRYVGTKVRLGRSAGRWGCQGFGWFVSVSGQQRPFQLFSAPTL